MATVGQYLDECRRWIGTREQPMGSNHVPGITDQAGFWDDFWCAMGSSVACRNVGIKLWTAAVAGVIERAQAGRDGWTWGSEPRLGALVCFDFPGGGRTDHVAAAVEAIRDDGMLVCIEFNHQDQCMRVVRDPEQWVIGYAYPPFDDQPTEEDDMTEDEHRVLWDTKDLATRAAQNAEANNGELTKLATAIRDVEHGIGAKVDEILNKLNG